MVTTWWDAPSEGNMIAVGNYFDPIEDGLVNTNEAGTYSFWSTCSCNECPSTREQIDFIINGKYYYLDNDKDGFGNAVHPMIVCKEETPPNNYTMNATDCNDQNPHDVTMEIKKPLPSGIYQANSSITASGVVLMDKDSVILLAGTVIKLEPGFSTQKGVNFLAKIDSCKHTNNNSFQKTNTIKRHPQQRNTSSSIFPATVDNIQLTATPNPFYDKAQIHFDLYQRDQIDLHIYDNFGRLKTTLLQGEWLEIGQHSFNLNASVLADGLYFVVLKGRKKISAQKIILATR